MDTLLLNRFWLLLAAVSGALLPVALSDSTPRKRAMVRVVCGTLIAIFMAPAIQRHFLPDAGGDIQAGVSFLVGCFGLKFTAIVQGVLDRHADAMADRWIRRVSGSGK
jgi:hypothetical protein